MQRWRATALCCFMSLFLLGSGLLRLTAQSVNVTTAQQDTPAVCSGCVYRTGQNLAESKITYSNLSKSSFGQYCSYALTDEITVSAPCERVDLEALKATKARRKGAER
jgi:hypothetical protein